MLTQTIRERIPELAVLKTVGFSNRALFTLVVVEVCLVCMVAALVVLTVAVAIFPLAANIVPGLSMPLSVIGVGAIGACLVGMASAAIPAMRAAQLPTVDARSNLNAYLVPYFGEARLVASLTSADFEKWQPWALTHKPRGRPKDGKQSKQAMRDKAKAQGKDEPPSAPAVSKEESLRRRKSRLNRIISDVHAGPRVRVRDFDGRSKTALLRGRLKPLRMSSGVHCRRRSFACDSPFAGRKCQMGLRRGRQILPRTCSALC